jgi:transglutaminase-like putative cysteine protease
MCGRLPRIAKCKHRQRDAHCRWRGAATTLARMSTMMNADINACLAPTAMVDSQHPAIREYAHARSAGCADDRQRAVALYYAVRDGIRYDPYALDLSESGFRASATLASGRGWCVPKAVLLAAVCRAIGIPAALGYADVRNHLSTERMRQFMQTDVFYWHGYTAILLDGQWVKATPAFNVELCDKFRIRALEFDGREDSIYHPLDLDGRQHMEYLAYRGEFADVPLAAMAADFRKHYPGVSDKLAHEDFDSDVNVETRRPA